MVPEESLSALFTWANMHGLALFPINAGAKAVGATRYTDGTFLKFATPIQNASFNVEQWRRWYSDYNGCNFGVAVTPSNLIVVDIDIDTYDGGKLYVKEWYDWLEAHNIPPHNTLAVRTPSGGLHLYYRTDEKNLKQPDLVAGKINVRANNGYVVAPWSVLWDTIAENTSVGKYEIYHDLPILAAPPALEEHCRGRSYTAPRTLSTGNPDLADDGLPRDHGKRWYAEQILHKMLDTVRRAPDGARNNTLNVAAVQLGHYVSAGYIDESRAVADLAAAAAEVGLTPEETFATTRSGLEAGKVEPIDLPRSALTDLATAPAPLLPYLGHPTLPPTASVTAIASMLEGRPLVEKLAIVGRVTVLAGKYSTGKTTAIMSLAYADICGMRHFMHGDFQAHNNPIFTQPSGWLICSFERTDHITMLGDAFQRGHGVTMQHPERLRLVDMPQEPLVRLVNRTVVPNEVAWKAIADEANAFREKLKLPIVVVIDNTAAAIGNRSDEEQAKIFMSKSHWIARLGHAVIDIAHPTKSGSSTVAGSSMFYDLADCVGELETIEVSPTGWVQWINFAKFRGPDDHSGMVLRSAKLDTPVVDLPSDWGAGNYGFYRRQQNALRLPYLTSIEVLPHSRKPFPGVHEVPAGQTDSIKLTMAVPTPYMPQG